MTALIRKSDRRKYGVVSLLGATAASIALGIGLVAAAAQDQPEQVPTATPSPTSTPEPPTLPDAPGTVQEAALAIMEPLHRAVENEPGFAGIYFEPQAGTIFVATAQDPQAIEGKVAAFGDAAVTVRVREVEHSLAELYEAKASVERDLVEWRSRGIRITSVGIDTRANRILVTVADTAVDLSALEAAYGAEVQISDTPEIVRTSACVSRSNCASPVKAGLTMTASGSTCTAGFVTRDIQWAGAYYLMTAGHCLDGPLGVTWFHNGSSIGTSSSNFHYDPTNVDVGYILLSAVANPGNQLFVTSTTIRSVTTFAPNVVQTQGVSVCKSGSTTNWTCGQIVLIDVSTVDEDDVVVLHGWKTNYQSDEGDSGAPVTWTSSFTTAFGIHYAGSGAGNAYYSPIDWIRLTTGKTPCLNALCN